MVAVLIAFPYTSGRKFLCQKAPEQPKKIMLTIETKITSLVFHLQLVTHSISLLVARKKHFYDTLKIYL